MLLAACMHAGVRVLDMSPNPPLGETPLVTYCRHESMAYGADWCRVPDIVGSSGCVVASCSFYDNLFCLWQSPLPAS